MNKIKFILNYINPFSDAKYFLKLIISISLLAGISPTKPPVSNPQFLNSEFIQFTQNIIKLKSV